MDRHGTSRSTPLKWREDATKIEVKKAIEEIFGVQVVSVNTINRPWQEKSAGPAVYTRRLCADLEERLYVEAERRIPRASSIFDRHAPSKEGNSNGYQEPINPPPPPSAAHDGLRLTMGSTSSHSGEGPCSRIMKKNAGRNNYGRITVRHRGGGNAQKYRIIDFKRDKTDMPRNGRSTIEYDPNRTAYIALLRVCGRREAATSSLPSGLKVGDTIVLRRRRRHQARQLLCPWRTSPSAPSSTTSRCTPARAPSWSAPPATPRS